MLKAMLACLKLYLFVTFSTSIQRYSCIEPELSDVVPKNSESEEISGFYLNSTEIAKFHIWPSGVIPYFIDDFSFDKGLRDSIRVYLDTINTVTGLRFVEIPKPPEDVTSRWVFFINRIGQLGCADVAFDNFTNEGVQKVVLGYDCLAFGGLAEIILSLVGVPPQHNSPDRDENIQVNADNILPDKLQLFNILNNDEWLFHDLPYDYFSAGHFSSHRYTSNGSDAISIRKDETRSNEEIKRLTIALGKLRKSLSTTDIKKINMLYNYISRNREGPIEVPGCDKLFSRGPNYNNYEANENSNLKPRRKPNKYLGIEEKKEDNFEKENPNMENDKNNNNTNALEESRSTNIVPRESNVIQLKHRVQKKIQILNESDYKTDDEG